MTRKLFHATRLLLLLLIWASSLYAQQLATFNITVNDPSGRLVAGARVKLNNLETGVVRSQVTDRSGFAILTALSAGDYSLRVQDDGFSEYEQSLTLAVGQVASVQIQLGLAAVKQSVSVSESSQPLSTKRRQKPAR